MATKTIIRVKRRREENPQDSLLVLCKRPKVDTASSTANVEEEVSSVFVFSGTAANRNDDIRKIVKTLPSTGRHQVNIIETLREERSKLTAKRRYEVINHSRGIQDGDALVMATADNEEVHQDETGNEEDPSNYEYDLYTTTIEFDPAMVDNIVRVDDYEHTWRLARSDDEDDDEESIDSNDELYYENDYPDEEDKMNMRSHFDSDDEDSKNSLSSDNEAENYGGESFENDVKDYGVAYARYKAKMMTREKLSHHLIHSVKIHEDESNDDNDMDSDVNNEVASGNDSDHGFYYGQDDEPTEAVWEGDEC